MAYNPITRDPIRVPPELLPKLRFAWPGMTDPSGFIGAGSPATSYSTAPQRYTVIKSNSPGDQGEAYTATAVITISATLPNVVLANYGRVLATTGITTDRAGMFFSAGSGSVAFMHAQSDAATTLQGSVTTTVGRTFTMIGVVNRGAGPYQALFIDGDLARSSAAVMSWTVQQTMSLGWGGSGSVWSGGIRDVYIFAGALSPSDVGYLHQWLKV